VNRSSFILGSALLVVAVTLAVTVTVRNAPRGAGEVAVAGSTGGNSFSNRAFRGDNSANPGSPRRPRPRVLGANDERASYRVQLPAEQGVLMPVDERAELTERAAIVESKAREQLERMTEEFDLSGEQRRKMFPMLARSMAGFDPRMLVGGSYLEVETGVLPDEKMHEMLDGEQRVQLEDDEIDRQLWWQDVFSRLERELVDSTGGGATVPTAVDPGPATGGDERAAPKTGSGGNLFDQLGQ
jgi:hypothetical protein